MTIDDALDEQLIRLARDGRPLLGWKVGFTSERARKAVGSDARPFGHLLNVLDSGSEVDASSIKGCSIEPELCFTIDEGGSAAAVSAGFELNERRIETGDVEALIADNLINWGIVVGDSVAAVDDINAVDVTLSCNGEVRFAGVSRDHLDDHYASIERLSETLAAHGRKLEPGQRVITGAFTRFKVAAGEVWSAAYSGIGSVEVTFV